MLSFLWYDGGSYNISIPHLETSCLIFLFTHFGTRPTRKVETTPAWYHFNPSFLSCVDKKDAKQSFQSKLMFGLTRLGNLDRGFISEKLHNSEKFHVLTKKMPFLSPGNSGLSSAPMPTMRADGSLAGKGRQPFGVPRPPDRHSW